MENRKFLIFLSTFFVIFLISFLNDIEISALSKFFGRSKHLAEWKIFVRIFFLRLGEIKLHGQKLTDFAYLSSKKFWIDFEVHAFGISDLKIEDFDV